MLVVRSAAWDWLPCGPWGYGLRDRPQRWTLVVLEDYCMGLQEMRPEEQAITTTRHPGPGRYALLTDGSDADKRGLDRQIGD